MTKPIGICTLDILTSLHQTYVRTTSTYTRALNDGHVYLNVPFEQ